MNNNKLELVEIPEEIAGDALTALLRNSAKALISQAVEAELAAILMSYQHENLQMEDKLLSAMVIYLNARYRLELEMWK